MHRIENQPVPSCERLIELIKLEVKEQFKEEPEYVEMLLAVVPTTKQSLAKWFKKDGFDEAVWSEARITGLFTLQKKSNVIEALYRKATKENPDVHASKIWLTLAGELQEKQEIRVEDSVLQIFREVNSSLKKGD